MDEAEQLLSSHEEFGMDQDARRQKPLVSVCIPAFNGERWIQECIGSALAQSYQPIELLVIDDASTDCTVELVRSFHDERIRFVENEENRGMVSNWNRCVELARGEFIKFLFQDDILYPDCVEKMMRLFLSQAGLGLVFSPRDIIIECDASNEAAQLWIKDQAMLHNRFASIASVNKGRELFDQYLHKGFKGNWIGEPSSVLVKKECFRSLGLFNPKLFQVCDIEMWLRIMFFYDVGFYPEKLSAFRFHEDSVSSTNSRSQRNWLDHLYLLEGLLDYDKIRLAYPEIKRMRHEEILRIIVRMIVPVQLRRKVLSHLRSR